MDPLILFDDVRMVVVKMIKQGNKLTSCPSDLMYGQQQEFTEIRTARKTHSNLVSISHLPSHMHFA